MSGKKQTQIFELETDIVKNLAVSGFEPMREDEPWNERGKDDAQRFVGLFKKLLQIPH